MSTRIWVLALTGALIVCYLPHILWAEWVYEDLAWVIAAEQDVIHPRWTSRGLTRWAFVQEWRVSRSPPLFHAIGVVLHAVVAALAGILGARLGLSRMSVWLVVMIMLLHPLTSEAVAYAAQQGELIAAIGVLGSITIAAGPWRAWTALALLTSVLIGLGAKESAVVVVLLVPLTWWATKKSLWELGFWCGLTTLVIGVIITGGLRMVVNAGESPGATVAARVWLLAQSAAIVRTLGLLIVPLGLTVDYDYDIVPLAWRWLSVLVLMAVVGTAWRIRTRWRLEAFCVWSILLVIAPRLIIQTPRSYVNDHQAYLMVPFFAILVASLWERARE